MKILVNSLLLSAISTASVLAQSPTIIAVVNGFSYQNSLSPGVLARTVEHTVALGGRHRSRRRRRDARWLQLHAFRSHTPWP